MSSFKLYAMDIVEDFLHITKVVTWPLHLCMGVATQVNVSTLIQLLAVLRRRLPGRHLPILILSVWLIECPRRNLKQLVDLGCDTESDKKNLGKRFWSWLSRQEWRKVLPMPTPRLGGKP